MENEMVTVLMWWFIGIRDPRNQGIRGPYFRGFNKLRGFAFCGLSWRPLIYGNCFLISAAIPYKAMIRGRPLDLSILVPFLLCREYLQN